MVRDAGAGAATASNPADSSFGAEAWTFGSSPMIARMRGFRIPDVSGSSLVIASLARRGGVNAFAPT